MAGCIFCMIANGEIPTNLVFENDLVAAFDDLHPQAPVHTLVVPKAHYQDVADGVPPETMAAIFQAVCEVARIKGIEGSGFRIISNKGADAGQTVPHFHVHVLGGKRMDEGLV